MQTNEILNLLKNKKVQDFINEHLDINTSKLALKFAGKVSFNLTYVLKYLKLLQKAKSKLPTYYKKRCYLTDKSYEQATSERVAQYKAKKIIYVKLLNLTGGLGVDDWAFSTNCETVTSLDIDAELNQLVNENITLLNTPNITRLTADAYEYVKSTTEKYDAIYIDPDRRDENSRVYSLTDSEPDYFKLKNDLFRITDTVIIKASPMLDITELERSLEGLKEIIVIAENNEVKELLLFINRAPEPNINITAVNLSITTDEYKPNTLAEPNYTSTGSYFIEPNKAIIKAGLHKLYSAENGLNLIHPKAAYMLTDELPDSIQGRSFKVEEILPYKPKQLKKQLKQRGIKQANIAKRNFRETVDELYKITGLKDGGKHYLFFTTSLNNEALIYLTVKA